MPSVLTDSNYSSHPVGEVFDRRVRFDDLPTRLRRYRLGLALYIISIAMLFVGFTSAYVVRRGVPSYDPQTGTYSTSWEPLKLPIGLLLLNTVWLCLASVSIENTRRRLPRPHSQSNASIRNSFYWLLLSLVLAIAFVAGQLAALRKLRLDGFFLSSGPRTAFFYLFVGTHAFHAIVGVIFVAALAIAFRCSSSTNRFIGIDLAAWYLHAMAVLWIYLFGFLAWA